jgi:hypothetical protein
MSVFVAILLHTHYMLAHITFPVSDTSLKMADKGRNM